ncbi:P83/100 protein [Treponema bryantii]|uniref:p83/100 protein n=1 Tax=Treponema bryantii TaxID=163 RepID=A0A1I3J142_9SPIR|nr:P83/100 family protein [Treponema bryantii]SFI53991.1 P83/100 protein [Treponema bryantii]
MKKYMLLLVSAIFSAGLFALEVNKNELNSTGDTTIEFINYTGPHKVIDSVAAIKGIGSGLGNQVAKDPSKPTSTAKNTKYYVIHAVDESETGKLDADILFIGADATVDHIKNLRRIIAAYLSSAYGYSEADADTLSVFITVYNAVYRSKLDTFKSKYKNVVIENLSADNCGLSVNYKDWPGKSEIVIPLYDVNNGGLSTVDTSVISDSSVVNSMKEDDDMNVESRKEMVDIKEREADAASEKAKEAQKEAVSEQKKLEEEKKKTTEAKKEADDAQKKAEEKQKVADQNPDDKKAQEEAKEAKNEAEEKKQAAEEQQAKTEEQQAKTDEKKQEAKEQQTLADKKETEAQNERKEIAKDQAEVQKKEAAQALMSTEFGIILSDEANMLSSLVKFNIETGEVVKNSPVAQIRNRTVYKEGENFIAIAGENSKKGAVKLVTIDPETLEISAESDNTISENSVLVKDGSDYYCVVDEGGKFYLGKFGADLSLKLKSQIQVKAGTPVTVTDGGIVVTDSNGKLRLLDKKDLSVVSNSNNADAK